MSHIRNESNTINLEMLEQIGSPPSKYAATKSLERFELFEMLYNGSNLRDRALLSTLYLTNSRIGEVVKRVYKHQIEHRIVDNHEFLLFKNLYTEKNKNHPKRNVPVMISKENKFTDLILEYLKVCPHDKPIFNFTRQWAWNLLKRNWKLKPHDLRHTRITHLITEYDLGETAIMRLAGWSGARGSQEKMMLIYSHLRWQDIARMMIRA